MSTHRPKTKLDVSTSVATERSGATRLRKLSPISANTVASVPPTTSGNLAYTASFASIELLAPRARCTRHPALLSRARRHARAAARYHASPSGEYGSTTSVSVAVSARPSLETVLSCRYASERASSVQPGASPSPAHARTA